MDPLTLVAVVLGSGGIGGGIAALINARTNRDQARRIQDREDDAADLSELRTIAAEQRSLIDEYRREYAHNVDRIERLENTVKWQGSKIMELLERDEDCRQELALTRSDLDATRKDLTTAHTRIKQLEDAA